MKKTLSNLTIKNLFTLLFTTLFSIPIYANTIRIMPLGDSITYGYPSPSGYRSHLWYKLQDAKYNVNFVGSLNDGYNISPEFDFNHEGYGGFKTFEISEIVYGLLVDNQPDIILLHIGSNDVSPTQGLNSSSVKGLIQILNQIDIYEQNYNHEIHIILASIINRKNYHKTVTEFNYNLRVMAKKRILTGDKITLINMESDAGLNSSDFYDLTHPNTKGYAKMSTLWFSELNNILPSFIPENPLIKPFVERFYTEILSREGEASGVEHWTEGLQSGKLTATDLARHFIFSDEFKNKNTDNITFLSILYNAFFDREAENDGLSYWEKELIEGETRFSILNGFLNSQEFKNLINIYNIRL